MILDPWSNNNLVLQEGKNIIRGAVIKKDGENIRHDIEFNYRYDSSIKCGILNTTNKTNNYNNIGLKLFDDNVVIENISRSNIYRGSEYMLLALQIIYKLNYKQSKLKDLAYFTCDRKMNYFSNSNLPIKKDMEIYNKLIYLLRFGGTFYMPFGYKPVIQKNILNNLNFRNIVEYNNNGLSKNGYIDLSNTNYIDLSNTIDNLLQKLNKITWIDIDLYLDNIKSILNNNKLKNNSKIFNFRIYDYKKWKIYWLNIIKSWKTFYNKFNNLTDTPFLAFSLFNKNECDVFINWLELYSFSVEQTKTYNSSIFDNNIDNSIKILAGIDDFKILKSIVSKCEWLNNNIKNQPLISFYNEKI